MIKRAELIEVKGLAAPWMILPLGRDEFLIEQRPSNQSTRCILGRADEKVDVTLLEVSGDPSLVRKNKSEADVGCLRLQERDEFRCEDGSWIVRCGDPEDAAARGVVEDLRDVGELAQALDQLGEFGLERGGMRCRHHPAAG